MAENSNVVDTKPWESRRRNATSKKEGRKKERLWKLNQDHGMKR
jgi:hypothetical protein